MQFLTISLLKHFGYYFTPASIILIIIEGNNEGMVKTKNKFYFYA